MTVLNHLLPGAWCVCGALLLCGGCDSSADSAQEHVMVFGAGSYASPSGRYLLLVPDQGGVEYTITDFAAGTVVLQYDGNASRYQRWFLCWGPDDRLWHYTGDDGEFHVWSVNAAGKWQKRDVVDFSAYEFTFDDALIREMPLPVFDHLPPALKERWGLVVEQDEHGKKAVRRSPGDTQPDSQGGP
jgi:hypothetical protein